jgi:hypothetical protein
LFPCPSGAVHKCNIALQKLSNELFPFSADASSAALYYLRAEHHGTAIHPCLVWGILLSVADHDGDLASASPGPRTAQTGTSMVNRFMDSLGL